MRRIVLIIAFVLSSSLLSAQAPQRGGNAQDFMQMRRMMDWAGFNRYADANKEVKERPLVIFMGDSITDFWGQYRPDFFTEHNYLCRGIGAQTVEHMLARFHADVIDLHPRAVVILAGINNIAGNNGTIAFENVVGCIASMCEAARANGIIPVISSILPCDRFFWNPEAKPAQDVIRLNGMLKEYAAKSGIAYVDYHSQMGQPDGSLPTAYSEDGCHPTVAGYEKMEEIIVPEIQRILATVAPARPAGPARQVGPTDWPAFKRYETANAEIDAAPLLVLMGDSITDYWYDTDPYFFTRNRFAGRGIAGQTASQMLVRFKQDVIALKPKAVAIMAGTNDLCQNMMGQSYYPDQTIIDNIVAMCELAEAAGIKVLLCSITPCAHYMPIPDVDAGSVIVKMNKLLKSYADTHKNVTYVDYFTPLVTPENGLDDSCSYDGIHPAVNIYDDMERILVDSVRKVLKLKKQDFYTLPSDEADRRKAEADADRKAKNMPMNFKGMVEMMNRMRMR